LREESRPSQKLTPGVLRRHKGPAFGTDPANAVVARSVAARAILRGAEGGAYIVGMEPAPLTHVSDDERLRRLVEILGQSRHTEADFVVHIGEVDARRLYAREASPSMFAYCTERLHLSEAEAYLRIAAARAAREHPVLLEMLTDGRLHLTAIAKLAPHLTPENRDRLLARATHRTKREVEGLVAEVAPRPDAPTVVRRLPGRGTSDPEPRAVQEREAPEQASPGLTTVRGRHRLWACGNGAPPAVDRRAAGSSAVGLMQGHVHRAIQRPSRVGPAVRLVGSAGRFGRSPLKPVAASADRHWSSRSRHAGRAVGRGDQYGRLQAGPPRPEASSLSSIQTPAYRGDSRRRLWRRARAGPARASDGEDAVAKFLLWLILLVLCWPLALLALVLYPLVWLLLLPFRLLGFAVEGVLALVKAVILLPARLLRGPGAGPGAGAGAA
jgi:hypothetical protein